MYCTSPYGLRPLACEALNAILMNGTTRCHDRVATVDDLVRKALVTKCSYIGIVFPFVGENALPPEEIEVGSGAIAFSAREIVRLTDKLFLRYVEGTGISTF